MNHRTAALLILPSLLLVLCAAAAPAQSLGMLLQEGLLPGLGGKLLRLSRGPITGGEGVDLAVSPGSADLAAGVLLGSCWGDLLFYAGSPGQTFGPPQVWLGADPAQWDWPPQPRQVSPELVDWDADGDLDLLLGWGDLLLWYPRQAGALGAGQQLRCSDGQLLTRLLPAGTGHVAPCVGDLDGDGRPDLVLGAEDGTVWWCRNAAAEAGFSLETPRAVVGPTGPLRVGARARCTLGDFNGDQRPDLLVGEAAGKLTLWPAMPTGLGPAAVLVFPEAPEPPLAGAVAPRCLAEGGLALVAESSGFVRLVQISGGGVYDRGRQQGSDVPLDLGSAPALSAVDADGDGDLDLLSGSAEGRVWLCDNQSGGPLWELQPPRALTARGEPLQAEGGYSWPLLVDADGDGDLDLLLGTGSGRLDLLVRTADLSHGLPVSAGGMPLQGAGPLAIAAEDWDHDGKLDLLVGCRATPAASAASYQIRAGQPAYFQNEATGPRGLPLFTKGTPVDLWWRKSGEARGRLPELGLSLLQPLPAPSHVSRFLGLGAQGTYLFDCESRPPLYPVLTLPTPSSSPPTGVLPALYSLWVTRDPSRRPDQVLCGLAEYGMVCLFTAESLGLR